MHIEALVEGETRSASHSVYFASTYYTAGGGRGRQRKGSSILAVLTSPFSCSAGIDFIATEGVAILVSKVALRIHDIA